MKFFEIYGHSRPMASSPRTGKPLHLAVDDVPGTTKATQHPVRGQAADHGGAPFNLSAVPLRMPSNGLTKN